MKPSKFTSIFILLMAVALLGAFSFPMRAKAGPAANQQNSGDFVKRPTNTKKPKNTPPPRRTPTPRPASTSTRAAGTNPPTLASTQVIGSPVSTSDGSPTVPPTSNPLFSPTPTALAMSTIAAQQTATVAASYLTSTAVAGLYSPTPTSLGAEKVTPAASSDPASLAVAMTTTPINQFSQAMTVTSAVVYSPTVIQAPMDIEQGYQQASRPAGNWSLLAGVGVLTLLSLVYLLYREWKKTSLVVNNDQK